MKKSNFRGNNTFEKLLPIIVKTVLALSVSFAFWGKYSVFGVGDSINPKRVTTLSQPSVIRSDMVGFLGWLVFDSDQPKSKTVKRSSGYQPDDSDDPGLTDKMVEQTLFLLENMPVFINRQSLPDPIIEQTRNRETPQVIEENENRETSQSKNKRIESIDQHNVSKQDEDWDNETDKYDFSHMTSPTNLESISHKKKEKESQSIFGGWFAEGKTFMASATNWLMGKVEGKVVDEPNSKRSIEIKMLQVADLPVAGKDKLSKGIEYGGKENDPGAGSTFFERLIQVTGNTVYSDETLATIVDVGEGLNMTLGILNLYSQEIQARYLNDGYFLSKTFVPKQEVVDGVVKIVVKEGQIDQIRATVIETIPTAEILKELNGVIKEQTPNETTLEKDLLKLNDIVGIQAKSLVKPSQNIQGTSVLEIVVKELLPYTFALDGDNFGSTFTGRNRFGVSATAGNLFQVGYPLALRGVASEEDQKKFQASYSVPVTDGGGTIGFSYTFSKQTLGLDFATFNASGETKIATLEFVKPLYRSRKGTVKARAGLDYRNFSNFLLDQTSSEDLLFGGFLGISGNYKDEFQGQNYFDISLHRGFNETNEKRALASRVRGEGDVTVGAYNFSRTQNAGFWDSYFVIKSLGHIASTRSLSPDLIFLGGFSSIRGYPLADQSGDQGFAGTLEYIIPVPDVVNVLGDIYNFSDHIAVFGFVDHGKVFVLNNQPGENDTSITAAGAGVSLTLPQDGSFPFLSINGSYGIPLSGPDPSDRSNGIWYVNAYIAFRFGDA